MSCALFVAVLGGVVGAAVPPPHIIALTVDDWGYYDVGFRGNPEAVTPNMDALVSSGIRLDRHYVFKYCSPSRSAFQTGRNPIHVNVLNLEPWVVNSSDPVSGYAGIPVNITTIAEKMAAGGYYTAAVGKWDVGMASPAHTPLGRGFNESLGYFVHANDYWTAWATYCPGANGAQVPVVDLWDTTAPARGQNNSWACSQASQTGCVYEDALFTARVLSIIEAHDPATPLFLSWTPHVAHVPLEVPQAYLDKFKNISVSSRRSYMAMVNYIDDQVGAVVAALKARGLWENTLWVSSADNGGPVEFSGANNWPLKGGKFSNWEGGIRANAYVSGGFVPPSVRGTVSSAVIAFWDWYATFSSFAGQSTYDPRAAAAGLPQPDSFNVWPHLSGANSTSPRSQLLLGSAADPLGPGSVQQGTVVQGVISPPYKLILGPLVNSVWTGPVFPNGSFPDLNVTEDCGDPDGVLSPGGTGCLFDLEADPYEHTNLATSLPATVRALRTIIASAQQGVFQPLRGTQQTAAMCAAAFGRYGGFLGPFVGL